MQRFRLSQTCTLVIRQGDITAVALDAVVNAANERMLGGGGVDGAIHRAAGPELVVACERVEEVRPGVRCPTGEARMTPGFDLPSAHVIHTVGPVYESPEASAPLLESAYASSLTLANEHRLRHVAFPAISCGVFGYPLDEAAPLSLRICRREAADLAEIHFVLFGDDAYGAWLTAARAL